MAKRGGVSIAIKGLPELDRKLKDLPDRTAEGLREATQEAAEAVETAMEQAVPIDSGELRDSIGIEYSDGDMVAEVGSRGVDYAEYVESGTSSMTEQPFVLPAAEEERPRYPKRIKDAVTRRVTR